MITNKPIVAALAAFFSIAPEAFAQTAAPDPTPRSASVALSAEGDQAIRKVITDLATALNAHDMTSYASLFREDAEWINIVGMHWHGRDAIVAAHTAFLDTVFKDNRMKIDAIETRSLGNGCATAVAR